MLTPRGSPVSLGGQLASGSTSSTLRLSRMVVAVGVGGAAEVAAFQSVAVAFEVDDFGVVDQAVDHGGGDGVVTEDFAPAAEGFVGGDDEAGPLVAGGDELEEQVGGLALERTDADANASAPTAGPATPSSPARRGSR